MGAQAEQIEGKENPRYVVTSLGKQAWPAQQLHERLYCARGERENRIKEQLSLCSDRLSSETMRANQLRLYFSSLGYVLLHALRRLGLRGNSVGRSASPDDPAAAAENCRAGAHDRAENPGLLQRRLSLETYVRCCWVGATLLNSRSVENATSRT